MEDSDSASPTRVDDEQHSVVLSRADEAPSPFDRSIEDLHGEAVPILEHFLGLLGRDAVLSDVVHIAVIPLEHCL